MTDQPSAKKILKWGSLSLLFAFIAFYAFFGAKDLLLGVKIRDVAIESVSETEPNVKKVAGIAKNAKLLSLNGREIFVDQEGYFNETLVLLPGYNVLSLQAEDKFGLQDHKNYQLVGRQ